MLNQAKPASLSGSNSGRTLVLLLPSSNPPPWIRMAAANGPGPSGTCRSSSNGWPPGRAYSTSFLSRGAAARVAAQAIARMKAGVRMEDDCTRGGTGLLACPSSCYKCVVSYYERHLPHWQPEGAALFLTWRLARIAPENRADLGSPWVKLFQQIRAGQWFRYFTGAEVLGGVLVLISWTATAGLALLACTMAAADSIFSGIFFIALSAFWWSRRSR